MARKSTATSSLSHASESLIRLARRLLEAHGGREGLSRSSAQFSLVPEELRAIRQLAGRGSSVASGMDFAWSITALTLPTNREQPRLFSGAKNAMPGNPYTQRTLRNASAGAVRQAAAAASRPFFHLDTQRVLIPSFGPRIRLPISSQSMAMASSPAERVGHFLLPVSLPSREEQRVHTLPPSNTFHIHLDAPLNEDYLRSELIPLLERLQATG